MYLSKITSETLALAGDISNEIAARFEVYHQSPQLLLIKEGKTVYDASHSDIDALELKGKV